MFFGLCTSPATFQRMMDHIFEPLIRQGVMIVYIDDIFVFGGSSLKEHRSYVTRCSPSYQTIFFGCTGQVQFEAPEVSYLGFKVSSNRPSHGPTEVQAIVDWPLPLTKEDCNLFSGSAIFIGNLFLITLRTPASSPNSAQSEFV